MAGQQGAVWPQDYQMELEVHWSLRFSACELGQQGLFLFTSSSHGADQRTPRGTAKGSDT